MTKKIIIFSIVLLIFASLGYLVLNQRDCNLKPASPEQISDSPSHQSRDYRTNLPEEDKTAAYFQYPLIDFDTRNIGSLFGWRIQPIFRTPDNHTGIDIEGVMGEPIYSIYDGIVVSSGWNGGYGKMIQIKHDHIDGAFNTLYAHNSRNLVEVGDKVTAGQVIGYIGSTGLATGPHLHFEVRIHNKPVDPVLFMRNKRIGGF